MLVFRGSSAEGQAGFFNHIVKNYIEETAISRATLEGSQYQLAAAGSLTSAELESLDQGQGGSNQESNPDSGNNGTIVAYNPASTDYMDGDGFRHDQVVKYAVQAGDNIGSIAENFGVSINTIVWANNLKNPDVLSLGQQLKIPPVTGVIHTVQNGDTVISIANKYKAESIKILSFNALVEGQVLGVGDELIVPGGEQPGPKPVVKTIARSSGSTGSSGIYLPVGNGQCVAFVQAHGFAKMSGNASTWKRYINTSTPTSGGVVVLHGGPYGHVALITAVGPHSIQVVEQNYYGHYIIDHREISLNDKTVVGFIR